MARILDLELSSGSLAVRALVALVGATFTFVVFYVIPTSISGMTSSYLPASVRPEAPVLVASFISPALPAIGLGLTAAVFAGVLLRGTRAYGLALAMNGLLFAAYTYEALRAGTIAVTLPPGLPLEASGSISIDLTTLMVLLLLPSLLTVVKGLAITASLREPTRTSKP